MKCMIPHSTTPRLLLLHDDVIKFSVLLALCVGNSLVIGEFPSQRTVTRSFDVSLICPWINGWVNNLAVGDLRCHRAHHDATVMCGLSSLRSWSDQTAYLQSLSCPHKALSVWEDEQSSNKETNGLPTSRPLLNIFCSMVVMRYVSCMISFIWIQQFISMWLLMVWGLVGTRPSVTTMMAYSRGASQGVTSAMVLQKSPEQGCTSVTHSLTSPPVPLSPRTPSVTRSRQPPTLSPAPITACHANTALSGGALSLWLSRMEGWRCANFKCTQNRVILFS